MRIHATKEEKRKRERDKIVKAFRQLLSEKPEAADIFTYLDKIKSHATKQLFLRIFFRIACIDDLYCFIRSNSKYRERGWKVLLKKIRSNKHGKVILLQIAIEVPNLTIPALEKIADLGIELTYEDTNSLLGLRHIQLSPDLRKALEKENKAQREKINRIERIIERIMISDRRLMELS